MQVYRAFVFMIPTPAYNSTGIVFDVFPCMRFLQAARTASFSINAHQKQGRIFAFAVFSDHKCAKEVKHPLGSPSKEDGQQKVPCTLADLANVRILTHRRFTFSRTILGSSIRMRRDTDNKRCECIIANLDMNHRRSKA
jgi:hypothetical protein